MVQLKIVQMRLKSVKNIQKITKTMKMVSASKFTKAERELRSARPFGYAPRQFYRGVALIPVDEAEKDKAKKDDKKEEVIGVKKELKLVPPPPKADGQQEKTMYVAMTSDRGLCGGAHGGISRNIRGLLNLEVAPRKPEDSRLVCIGDKSRNLLKRQHSEQFMLTAKGIGRIAPTFADASGIANAMTRTGYEYDSGLVFYNKFVSAVRYDVSVLPLFSIAKVEVAGMVLKNSTEEDFFPQALRILDLVKMVILQKADRRTVVSAPNIHAYDEVEPDVVQSYTEFTLVACLYYALKECAASEQSARVAAMDAATGNADDAIKNLTTLLNRTRQAVVTRELIEIISGAAALK